MQQLFAAGRAGTLTGLLDDPDGVANRGLTVIDTGINTALLMRHVLMRELAERMRELRRGDEATETMVVTAGTDHNDRQDVRELARRKHQCCGLVPAPPDEVAETRTISNAQAESVLGITAHKAAIAAIMNARIHLTDVHKARIADTRLLRRNFWI